MAYLYSLLVAEDNKTKFILNSFCDQTVMTVVNLFKNLLQTVCFYSSMLVILKRVVSNKLLDSVLHLMDIRVVADNPTINSSTVRYDSNCIHKYRGTSKPTCSSPKGYFPSITSISKI